MLSLPRLLAHGGPCGVTPPPKLATHPPPSEQLQGERARRLAASFLGQAQAAISSALACPLPAYCLPIQAGEDLPSLALGWEGGVAPCWEARGIAPRAVGKRKGGSSKEWVVYAGAVNEGCAKEGNVKK